MVNIAGRSKGCTNCRRRRVKCDETRPICNRCQRQGLECDGPKGLAFIEGLPNRPKRTPSNTATTATTPTGQASATAGPSTAIIPIHAPPAPSAPLIGDPLDYYILFARAHLAPRGPMNLALQELQSLPPSQQSLALSRSNTTTINITTAHLETLLSFATIFFGTAHNASSILQKGLLTHGATLRRLNTALSQPDCWKYDQLIISVVTLAVQEAMVPTGPGHYMHHMLGLDRLLALRDPRQYRTPNSVALYKCMRHLILFAALQAGKKSILAREDWKHVLRETCATDDEREQNEVYEILADCSVLLVDSEQLVRQASVSEARGECKWLEMERQASTLRARLHRWRARWDAHLKNAYIETFPVVDITHTPILSRKRKRRKEKRTRYPPSYDNLHRHDLLKRLLPTRLPAVQHRRAVRLQDPRFPAPRPTEPEEDRIHSSAARRARRSVSRAAGLLARAAGCKRACVPCSALVGSDGVDDGAG